MGCASCSNGKDGKPAGCRSNGYCSSSGCNKLDVFDWLAGVPLPGGQQPFDAVEVRFKNTRKGFYRTPPGLGLVPGDLVVVEASPGHDVGMVSLAGELVRLQMERKEKAGDTFELRKVLRKATQEDIDRWHNARRLEDDTLFGARGIVRDMRLDMKLSDVEYQGDGTKAIFYYTAEERVDFRDLVRRFSDNFHIKVEMKQIGARQEAGRIGGIGDCGRELCCSTWLTDFRSVTTSAARYQQLALNPVKLAGQCGKLKCCLNYELDMYIEAVKSYPSAKAKLKTQAGTGMHIKTDIFLEKMWYIFKAPGQVPTMAGLKIEQVREIQEANKAGEVPFIDLALVNEPEPKPKTHDYENVVGQDDLTRFDSKIKSGKRKRGGGKKRSGGRPKGEQQAAPAANGEKPKRRKRGGKGRRKGGSGGGGDKPKEG